MSRALALFTYKLRFFFGPSLRGRFGPFAYLALIAIFLPSAYFTGLGLGMAVRSLDADEALAVLSAPLAAVLCVGLLYSLGAGVTARPSEFHFFLPADGRPREYLPCSRALPSGRYEDAPLHGTLHCSVVDDPSCYRRMLRG